jgi:cytochrome c oxidase cbb3-type subunit 3
MGPAAAATTIAGDPLHEHGRRIYNFRCYFCHGYSGDARTLASSYLQPRPRDFTADDAREITLERATESIRAGRPGTAMKAFAGILDEAEIAAVAAFVRTEFIEHRAPNTAYHTVANGWPDHERYRDAFDFARGTVSIDQPWESLSASQRRGKRLYMGSCITCHDHGRVEDAGTVWETRPITYPRDAYCTSCHDEALAASLGPAPKSHPYAIEPGSLPVRPPASRPAGRIAAPYLVHDTPPKIAGLKPQERRGEALYQSNCAFCHAADGTAKSWIGSFLEPHPRDFTDPAVMRGMTRDRLRRGIRNGLEGTSMPAWKTVLSDEEIDAVVAYISRAFHPVPGV